MKQRRLRDHLCVLASAIVCDPYLALTAALEVAGDRAGAAEGYSKFLERAAITDPQRAVAERKIQELAGRP